MQLPQVFGLSQCLSGILYWLHNPQMNHLWKCLWSRNWATGFAGNKKDFKEWLIIVHVDTDCSPDLPWRHPLPALWMQIKPFVQDIYNEYFSVFSCMIMKTLAWQSPFSELCVKKESIRLERWSLTTVQRTLTSYIKIERKNTHTHTQSSTWWSEAPSQAVKLGVSHTATTLTANKSQVYYTGAGEKNKMQLWGVWWWFGAITHPVYSAIVHLLWI